MRFFYRSISWWYWVATAALLGAALAGLRAALPTVIGLCVVQTLHFWFLERSATAFPVQVRLAYLAMLLGGLWKPLGILHWILFVGTWALVLTGYCLAARVLSLLPWNRTEPLSAALVRRTLFSPPEVSRGALPRPPNRRSLLCSASRTAVQVISTPPADLALRWGRAARVPVGPSPCNAVRRIDGGGGGDGARVLEE